MKPSVEGADDHWPLVSNLAMPVDEETGQPKAAIVEKQHATTSERHSACGLFRSIFPALESAPIDFLVDPIDGEFSKIFNPWPTRFLSFHKDGEDLILNFLSRFESDSTVDFNEFSSHVLSRC
jgi:hypothetical protein